MLLLGYGARAHSSELSLKLNSLHEKLFGDDKRSGNGMNSASRKLDHGQRFLANSFQPRRAARSERRTDEGTSHRLKVYREDQEKIRELHRIKDTNESPHEFTLDGPFLLQSHCVDEPSQLCLVSVSGQRLGSLNPEELKEFKNVASIDASINSLPLGSFSCFTSLRELNLTLNGICNLTFFGADFPHLQVLDLSYNSVSAEDTVSLGRLPRLKTLHLTGNQLHSLPLQFGSSKLDHAQLSSGEEAKQFEALEILMLDDNKLSSEVFYSLMNLERLKTLNLQGNRISEIPQVRRSLKPGQLPAAEREDEAHAETDADVQKRLKIIETFHSVCWETDRRRSALPLPELQHLNLADNKITAEEALIGAALFLKLRELDVHSNPLITLTSGHVPLLTFYLQNKLGIKINRKREREVERLLLKASTHPKHKVKKSIKRPFLKDEVCQKQTQDHKCEEKTSSFHQNTDFFITKTEHEPESELVSSSESKETAETKQRPRASSEECYRQILATKTNPDVLSKPVGIQTAVRILEHALRNLNVYRDSKPRLDSIQTPYRQREKRIKELPPLRPIKRPAQRVDELVKEMKESKTIKVVSLDRALNNRAGNRLDYEETRSLLRDLRKKHKMVHQKAFDQSDPNRTHHPAL